MRGAAADDQQLHGPARRRSDPLSFGTRVAAQQRGGAAPVPVHNTLALKGALLPCFCVLGPVFGLAAQLREQQLEEEQVDMYVPLL